MITIDAKTTYQINASNYVTGARYEQRVHCSADDAVALAIALQAQGYRAVELVPVRLTPAPIKKGSS